MKITRNNTKKIIIPRSEHCISRANISKNALKVLYRLNSSGYEAYLVGGGVRDLLLGREPKDFDVATSATPEEVKKVFRNCRLIGRRFRLAHVCFGREVIEVATFRAHHDNGDGEGHIENGMIVRDNVYGSVVDDAWRRDFSVNSLYYNINDFSVVDYTNGMKDLDAGVLSLIGDPSERYREDPVRMLRAVRFAAKLGFRISSKSEAPIMGMAPLLKDIPPARLFEEILKLFMDGNAVEVFELLRHYDLFGQMFPLTEKSLAMEEHHFPKTFLVQGMANTDERVTQDKPVTPAFLFAMLLWEPVRELHQHNQDNGMTALQAMQEAGHEVISKQIQHVALPRRYSIQIREIWNMQVRLQQHKKRMIAGLFANPRFRAAYDFLLLRCQSGEELHATCEWWTEFQEKNGEQRNVMINALASSGRKRRRPRMKKHGSNSDHSD
jgi:poly(A) polymerase